MECGTPSITSKIGAEGMNGTCAWSGAIYDTPGDFAASAVEVYADQSLWEEKQKLGYEILENRFQKDLFAENFYRTIKEIGNQLEQHRSANFLGKVLNYNSHRSTKFMSKWIEEKNQSKTKA